MEIVSTLSRLYEKDNQKSRNINDENGICSYFDYKNDIGYVQVKDFMNLQGKKLLTTLESMKEFSSIIIDLRDNYGGLRNYGIKYLYAPIYNDSVTVTHNWFIPDSDSNKVINNAALNRFVYCTDKNESGFYYTRKYTYKGESTQTKQSIYYLINRRTGSAADGYIAMIKENNLGTIVGSITRGEGLADSFYRGSLKHSGLVYIYFPSLCYNKDGTNNSVYGTKPDIYINKTKESFYKEKDLQENGIDINIYTERIKYDNILIKTIEMIQ
ncbi:MAG TPA: hypothetical protein GX707_15695 [Epulopiscium sp.]|nr:hypothetical protein [Candidatus Epulonipiscium sp.]